MSAPSAELRSAVQDLYSYFQRLRLASADGAPVRQEYRDQLAVGIATLLGAHQPEATEPLLNALALELSVLARVGHGKGANLRLLRKELDMRAELTEARAYRLFGELLAAYLELLSEQ